MLVLALIIILPFSMVLSFNEGVNHFRKIQTREISQFKSLWNKNAKRRLVTAKKNSSI
tara:strand:+ start:65 stop:238 length:174 start_codon:yes stop_codon:yes gene_type:complete